MVTVCNAPPYPLAFSKSIRPTIKRSWTASARAYGRRRTLATPGSTEVAPAAVGDPMHRHFFLMFTDSVAPR